MDKNHRPTVPYDDLVNIVGNEEALRGLVQIIQNRIDDMINDEFLYRIVDPETTKSLKEKATRIGQEILQDFGLDHRLCITVDVCDAMMNPSLCVNDQTFWTWVEFHYRDFYNE